MGRSEQPVDGSGPLGRLAGELRALRRSAGSPTYREMAARTHFSRSTLAQAASGRTLPSLPVMLAYVRVCGGEAEPWRRRWQQAQSALVVADVQPAALAESPWPAQPLEDGSDPDRAGCGPDAMTAHARKVAITDTVTIIGQVELRYSPSKGAAWARFEGYGSLDHLANKHKADIELLTHRDADHASTAFRYGYCFDYHWSDLLLTGNGPVYAEANVYLDGQLVAHGETDHVALA